MIFHTSPPPQTIHRLVLLMVLLSVTLNYQLDTRIDSCYRLIAGYKRLTVLKCR